MAAPAPTKYLSEKEVDAAMRVAEKTMECKCEFAFVRVPREGGAHISVGLHCHAYFVYHLRLPPWCYMVDSISEDLRQFTRAAARRTELEKPPAPTPAVVEQPPAPTTPVVLPPPAPPKLGSIKQPKRPRKGGKTPKKHQAPYSHNYAIEALLYPSGSRHQKKAKTSSEGFVRINVLSDEDCSSSVPSSSEEESSSSSAKLPPFTGLQPLAEPKPMPLVFEDGSDFSSSGKEEEDSEINSI
jgi:hypothetical protein